MSFRERMKVSPSNAELDLRCYLQSHGLTKDLRTNLIIVFPKDRRYEEPRNLFQTAIYKHTLPLIDTWTVPDFCWPHQKPPFVLYLDGKKVHGQHGVELRDIKINSLLEYYGIRYYRYKYKGKLNNNELAHLANIVREHTQLEVTL